MISDSLQEASSQQDYAPQRGYAFQYSKDLVSDLGPRDPGVKACRQTLMSCGHAKNEVGGGRERTGAGAVEREGEIRNECVCLVQRT